MEDTNTGRDMDNQSVYEIGYLIASVPTEQIAAEADKVKKIVTDAGAAIIAEGEPHHQHLAYEMRKKTVSGAYDTYDSAHFGWVKFEVGSDKIEAIKKAIEIIPSVLRMLVLSTVRENTYLGKRAPGIAITAAAKAPGVGVAGAATAPAGVLEEKKAAAPATIEEMDKSIDEMVKEA